MTEQKSDRIKSKGERVSLIACFILFAIYLINVLLGKVNISYGLNLPHFGNVTEFLVLSMVCVLLIIAALKRETAEKMLLNPDKTEGRK